jgi:hypothetical protein
MKKKSVYEQFQAAERAAENLNLRHQPKRQSKHIPASDFAPRRTMQRKVCKCGTCKSCVDDARWERIFQEKFASNTVPERSPYGCALSNVK